MAVVPPTLDGRSIKVIKVTVTLSDLGLCLFSNPAWVPMGKNMFVQFNYPVELTTQKHPESAIKGHLQKGFS